VMALLPESRWRCSATVWPWRASFWRANSRRRPLRSPRTGAPVLQCCQSRPAAHCSSGRAGVLGLRSADTRYPCAWWTVPAPSGHRVTVSRTCTCPRTSGKWEGPSGTTCTCVCARARRPAPTDCYWSCTKTPQARLSRIDPPAAWRTAPRSR